MDFIFTADLDFVDLALEELHQAVAPEAVLTTLAPGVIRVVADGEFLDLAERWSQTPPIFIRHICPVQVVVPLMGEPDQDLGRLRSAFIDELLTLVDPQLSASVQTRVLAADLPYKPFNINNGLAPLLEESTGVAINVRAPQQILSVICATHLSTPITRNSQLAYLGLSLAVHNLSNWAGGMRRFAREEGQISRAEFKLLEALEVFGITLAPRGVALDLGASPGGWTRVLRQKEQYVTAVDPGDLDPRLHNDRGVRHKRITAEAYLANEPDRFDLIVNDMRMDARDSARLMVGYANQLYPHGIALMTLKLPEQNRRPAIDHALNILRQAYTLAGVRQLFHNRSEVTVYLRR